MPKVINKLMPNAPVCSVRADTPISECVKILRNKNIGALIIASDDGSDGLGGIFTERDLIKNIELIQHGDFWNTPVRTVMSSPVRTVTVDELAEAPMIMAKFHIRHLPVVSVVAGKTHVIGVLSMRDIFRIMMESIDYKIDNIVPVPGDQLPKKSFGLFSQDQALVALATKGAKLGMRKIQVLPHFEEFSGAASFATQFDAVLIDLDEMAPEALKRALVLVVDLAKAVTVILCFRPASHSEELLKALHQFDANKSVHLLAKPVAFGLLYEQLLKARAAAI